MIRIATLPCLYDVKGSQPRPPHIHHRPRMEVQRGPLQVSWLRCRREAEGKNVNGKFGILRNYLYLCSIKTDK